MSSIYLPYQKIPRWNADRATIVLNCARMGLSVPVLRAWPCWEGGGDRVLDVSRNNIATFYGDCSWSNNAIKLAGTDQTRIKSLTKSDISTLAPFSLCMWINPLSLTNPDSDATIYLADKAWNLHFNNSGTLNFQISTDNTYPQTTSSINLSVNKWFFICAVFEQVGVIPKIYIDSIDRSSGGFSGSGTQTDDSGNDLILGNATNEWSGNFHGFIRQVILFPNVLTSSQIQTLHNNPYGMFEPIRSPTWIVPLAPTTAAPTTVAPTTLAPTTVGPTTSAPTTPTYTTIGPTTVPVATTPPPTTVAPTTLAPTTIAPTTLAPTTLAPTSLAPTTVAPTSLAPTTLEPTTLAPTTLPPTTLAPTTAVPTTIPPTTAAPADIRSAQVLAQVEWVEHVPTTVAPTTLPPTTLPPTTLAPTTLAPTSLAPTTLPPTTLAPTTLGPTTLAPTSLVPTTVVPTTVAPTTLVPTTLGPTTIAPTTIPSTTLPPTTGLPEEVCVKDLRSVIVKEISLKSITTKEIRFNGYLC